MKILITGVPGSGKTTLAAYAQMVGDNRFFDADEIDGLCEWRELNTGNILGAASKYKATGDSWYKKYGWYWNKGILKKILHSNPRLILCGSAENVSNCYKYFDKIFLLKKTAHQLLSNLLSIDRTNPFGKTPEQRKNFLYWQTQLIEEGKPYELTIVEGNDIKTVYSSVCQVLDDKT